MPSSDPILVCFFSAFLGAAAGAVAGPQSNAPADLKITEAQCEILWNQAIGHRNVQDAAGDLELNAAEARPFVKHMPQADMDASASLSKAEWEFACANGLVALPAVPGVQGR